MSNLSFLFACAAHVYRFPVPSVGFWMLVAHYPLLVLTFSIQVLLILRLCYWLFRCRADIRKVSALDLDKLSTETIPFSIQNKSTAFSILALFQREQVCEKTYYQLQPLVKVSFSRAHRSLRLLSQVAQAGHLLGFIYFCSSFFEIFYPLLHSTCPTVITYKNISFLFYAPCGGMLLVILSLLSTWYFKPLFLALEEKWLWFSHALYNYKAGYREEKPKLQAPSEYPSRLSKWLARGPVYLTVFVFFPIFFIFGPYSTQFRLLPELYLRTGYNPMLYYKMPYHHPKSSGRFQKEQIAQNILAYQTVYLPSLQLEQKVWRNCLSLYEKEVATQPKRTKSSLTWTKKPSQPITKQLLGHLVILTSGKVKGFWVTQHIKKHAKQERRQSFLYSPPLIQTPAASDRTTEYQQLPCQWPQEQMESITQQSDSSETIGQCRVLQTLSQCLAHHIIRKSQFSRNTRIRWVTFPIPH